MKKQMKFLICGFGNIAQRHFRNLRKLLPNCIINVYTHYYDNHRVFDNDLKLTYTKDLYNEYNIDAIFYDIDIAISAEEYDAVIICSLPPDRIDIAIKTARKGFNLFIEKPLSNNMNNVKRLEKIIIDEDLKCVIGFQMRQHPVLKRIKKLLNKDTLGSIYRIEITHSSDFKNWSKGRGKDFYAVNEEQGGGVIRSQIHELDYLSWLFGNSFYLRYVHGDINNNGIEDNVVILGDICYNNEQNRKIPVIMSLDFLSNKPIRDIRIFGKKKTILIDLIKGTIFDYKTNDIKLYNFEWNDLFLNEMEDFIKFLNDDYIKRRDSLANIYEGIATLELALEIKSLLGGI